MTMYSTINRYMPVQRRSAMRGFTLIEMMIAVLVMAIIAAIAYPSYLKEVRSSRRTTAITNLLNMASQAEKYYSTNNAYPPSMTYMGYASNVYGVPNPSQPYYNITYAVNTTGYVITATPVGDQAKDSPCMSFTLNNLGVKNVTGTFSGTPAQCWNK